MNVEEGEKVFGKRWNEWSEQQRIEFVKALDGTEPCYPIYLNLCCMYPEHIPEVYEKKILPPGTKAKLLAAKVGAR